METIYAVTYIWTMYNIEMDLRTEFTPRNASFQTILTQYRKLWQETF